ncbi:hypothetical protein ACFVRR_03960 [Gottfriedia sp. NPDC057948]|uniref:hypothetical protein n=1 Tax=Gottfriedia sp. NPDC057948 TaxID=3346287 RepID=UPI0036DD7A00
MFELLQINNEISNKRCSTLQINIWEVQINKDIQIKDVALHINIWEVQINNDMLQINSELQIKFENSKKKFRILSKKTTKTQVHSIFHIKRGHLFVN